MYFYHVFIYLLFVVNVQVKGILPAHLTWLEEVDAKKNKTPTGTFCTHIIPAFYRQITYIFLKKLITDHSRKSRLFTFWIQNLNLFSISQPHSARDWAGSGQCKSRDTCHIRDACCVSGWRVKAVTCTNANQLLSDGWHKGAAGDYAHTKEHTWQSRCWEGLFVLCSCAFVCMYLYVRVIVSARFCLFQLVCLSCVWLSYRRSFLGNWLVFVYLCVCVRDNTCMYFLRNVFPIWCRCAMWRWLRCIQFAPPPKWLPILRYLLQKNITQVHESFFTK